MNETAEILLERGLQSYERGEWHLALELFQQAQRAYREDGNLTMAAEASVNLAVVHQHLGEDDRALEFLSSSMAQFAHANDDIRYAKALGNLGGIYRALGAADKAYDAYREAADIFQSMRERELYGETLVAMGHLLLDQGKWIAGATTIGEGLRYKDKLTARQYFIKGIAAILARLTGATDPQFSRS